MTPQDDLDLTAYALGELPADAPEDAAAIEARLATDADARQYVEQVRAEAARLSDALAGESTPALSKEQRAMIDKKSAAAPTRPLRLARLAGLAMAACLLLGIGLAAGLLWPTSDAARRTARQDLPLGALATADRSFSRKQDRWRNQPHREASIAVRQDSFSHGSKSTVGEAAPRTSPPTQPQDAPAFNLRGALSNRNSGGPGQGEPNPAVTFRPKQLNVSGVVLLPEGQNRQIPAEPEPNVGLVLPSPPPTDREAYDRIVDNPFRLVLDHPLSTFSVDVDTASYTNMRRFIRDGQLPPPDAVRIEELVNYFDYDYSAPADTEAPFAAHVEIAAAPWAPKHRLVRVGLKGYEVDQGERGRANLVFLLDVSGSMNSPDKLPLVKAGMKRLVNELRDDDRVAIVVYAGASGLALPSTPASNRAAILQAIESLQPGGSTNGAAGIELAYQQAVQHFVEGGVNRVILATDGDFNVGVTDRGQLTRLIEDKARSGVYLSVLGFGKGNLQDATMEELSNKGDGNYAYIDSLDEAQRVLVEQMGGTLVAIAKDVKLQIEFNPAQVAAYRLIGYENRILAKEDFNDDTKDAGDIGSGHTVTALYELVLTQTPTPSGRGIAPVDELKYQQPAQLTDDARDSDELLTLKLRYKAPDAPKEQGVSKLIEFPVADAGKAYADASADFRFAAAVASFGMILRDSPHKGNATFGSVIELAEQALGDDPARIEFVELVQKAATLAND